MKLDEMTGLLVDRAMELFEEQGVSLIPFEQDHLYDAFEIALEQVRDGLGDLTLTNEDDE